MAADTRSGQLKHRWSLAHNYLAGITAGDWFHLLRDNGFAIDPVYWHRAAFITLASLMNAGYRLFEAGRFGAAIAATRLAGPPTFILGHWRSGTTHLQNLLALDTRQFAFANTYEVMNPHTFLCSERINTRLFRSLVPKRRPMDNMALSFQAPQEDEFAILLATLVSPYLGVTFTRREDHYSRYLTLRDATPREVDSWKTGFLWFLKKLTLKYGRPLLLKSPPHTGRVRLLLDMFPDARFVHIHREPYAVFQSFQHYFDTAMWYTYLQRPDLEGIADRILHRYTVLYDAFFEDRRLIPGGQYHEMGFEDLERDPEGQIEQLYRALGLDTFGEMRQPLRVYVRSLAGYKKNAFPALPEAVRRRVARAWGRTFAEWGYAV